MTSAALGRFIMAMLYMDDTTLVARYTVRLQSLTEKYKHFCKMFRMRLNHNKSKDIHSRWVFKDGEDAGYEAGGVQFEQPKAPEKTLANESISRKDPHKVTIMFFSFKSLYHPEMCLGTTRDHSRALRALGAGAVPPGTNCQTPQCHLVKRPRLRSLPD